MCMPKTCTGEALENHNLNLAEGLGPQQVDREQGRQRRINYCPGREKMRTSIKMGKASLLNKWIGFTAGMVVIGSADTMSSGEAAVAGHLSVQACSRATHLP